MSDADKSDKQFVGPQAAYEKFLKAGKFMLQRSRSSGAFVFYPRVLSRDGHTDLEWVEASGGGTIYAITVNRKRDGINCIALIDLDEGVRMMSTILGAETLPIGTRVRARIDGDREPRIVFVEER